MARARNIKPGFYKNADLAECSSWARLIWPGLWMLADREGRLLDRPKQIKGELLPFDSVEVDPLLNELDEHNFITRYRVAGVAYVQIINFLKHQTPHHREPPSVIPPPSSLGLTVVANNAEPRAELGYQPQADQPQPRASPPSEGGQAVRIPDTGLLNADSGLPLPDPGLRTADTPRPEAAAKRSRRKPGTELPPEFGISDRVRTWAQAKGFDRIEEHLEAFCSKARKRGYVYVDWDEALMDAVRNDWAGLRGTAPRGSNSAVGEEWLQGRTIDAGS